MSLRAKRSNPRFGLLHRLRRFAMTWITILRGPPQWEQLIRRREKYPLNDHNMNVFRHVAEAGIRSIYGTSARILSLENWGQGALNTCLKVSTNPPGKVFFLKIENEGIIPRTRRGQIEREVYSMQLMEEAGIACPVPVKFDFSGNETGHRYLLEEFIDAQLFWEIRDHMTGFEREMLGSDISVILEKMESITSPFYGDIYPTGVVGQHPDWSSAYQAIMRHLLADSEELLLFSPGELQQVREHFAGCINGLSSPERATYHHGDLGVHNVMVDHSTGFARLGQVIDFGNATFYPRYVNGTYARLYGQFGLKPVDVQASYGISQKEQAANDHLFTLEQTIFRAMLKQKYNVDTGDFKGQFLAQIVK